MQNLVNKGNLASFRDFIQDRTGLIFAKSKLLRLQGAIKRTSQMAHFPHFSAYLAYLQSPEGEQSFSDIIPLLTTNESYFFRNEADFELLQKHLLPECLGAAASDKTIRIWSAGCATGEEAYSIAIVLSRVLPQLTHGTIEIVGTDIDASVVETARAGLYYQWSFRGLSPDVLTEAFDAKPSGFQVKEQLRSLVHFKVHNLIDLLDPATRSHEETYDIIFCRNVSIYFNETTTSALATVFHDLLKPKGYLFVGCGEHSEQIYRQFETRIFPNAIVYQKKALGLKKMPSVVLQKPKLRLVAQVLNGPSEKGASPPILFPDPKRGFSEAISLYFEKKILRSQECFLNLVRRFPEDAASTWILAHIAVSQGDFAEARRWALRCLQIDALFKEAYYTLSVIGMSEGHFDEAVSLIKKALYIDSGFLLAHFVLGSLLRLMSCLDESQAAFTKMNNLIGKGKEHALLFENEFLVVEMLVQQFKTAQKRP